MPPLDPDAAPERIAPGCLRIALPDPFVPGVTAVFLLANDTPVLVDAGAGTDECERALRERLGGLGHTMADLAMILTHSHLDHAGGLLRASPRELTVHARAAAEMRDREPRSSRGPAALRVMGLDEAAIVELAPGGEPVGDAPLADVKIDRELEGPAGELPGAPGWRWILAEGHAPGHLMLYDATSRTLIAADQFLQKWKTPLIVSDPEFDSFGAYLDSVEAALALDPRRICSSHTETIEDAGSWLADTRDSLRKRRDRVAEAVRGGRTRTGGSGRPVRRGDAQRPLSEHEPRPAADRLPARDPRDAAQPRVRAVSYGARRPKGVERFRPAS